MGDHDTEKEAARAFDRAAINKGGVGAKLNFDPEDYEDELDELIGKTQGHFLWEQVFWPDLVFFSVFWKCLGFAADHANLHWWYLEDPHESDSMALYLARNVVYSGLQS